MARYNNTDETIKAIRDRFNVYFEIPCDSDDRRVQEIIGIVIRTIKEQPSADVVPKSEVENLEKEVNRLKHILDCYALQYGTVTDKQKVIDEVKQEVAREIFEEIENFIPRFKVGYFSYISLTDGIAELKKKYTGKNKFKKISKTS